MDSPRYSITYCSGTGMGLLAISSCAIGSLIAMVLASKDSPLVTSRIQAITVTDVGRFFIKRVLAPNELVFRLIRVLPIGRFVAA